MKKNLPLIVIQFTLLVILSNCQSVSIQTTNYLQNGDRLANENNLAAAKSEYLQYLKLGAKLGIYRNELLEAETHRKLAYVYSAEGNYDSAIIQLNFALAKDLKFPDNPIANNFRSHRIGAPKSLSRKIPGGIKRN